MRYQGLNMNKQNEILKVIYGKDSMTKKEIVKAVPFSYWNNTEKYIGEILTRMVRSGKLERIGRGIYKVGPGKKEKINPDQIVIKM